MHHHPTSKVVTKKTKPNGFAIFMQDLRDRYREEGQRVPSMAEMVNLANPLWSNLSQQDKSYFNQRAKVASKSGYSMAKVVADTRLDCVGEPIADRVDEKGQIEERRKSERHFTRARFGVAKSAAKCRFFFIDFQFICKVEKGNYIPCEVAAIEYSIECGIIRTWHKFIDPGKIPTGYRYEAQNRSEQVHNVPIDKFELAESNYERILDELQQFINPHRENEFPPIFARKEEAEMVESCCRWLAERTDTDHELFKVYVLEYLLIDLSAHISDISPSSHEAKDMLSSSAFDYEPGTNCAWHESREIRHCSQGMVNRHAYIFSDHLCPKYNITMGPTHLPLVREETQRHTVLSPGPQEPDVVFPSRDIRYFPSSQPSSAFTRHNKFEFDDNESLASYATETTATYPQQSVRAAHLSSPSPGARKGRGRARSKLPTHEQPVVGGASSTFGTVGDTVRDNDMESLTSTELALSSMYLGSAAAENNPKHSIDSKTTSTCKEPPVSGYPQTSQSSSHLPDSYYNPYPLPPSNPSPLPPTTGPLPTSYYTEPQYQHLYPQQLTNTLPAAYNPTPPNSANATSLINPYQQQMPPNLRASVPSMTHPAYPTQSQLPCNPYSVPSTSPLPPPQPQSAPYQYPHYHVPPAAPQPAYPYHQQTTYDQFNNYNPNSFGQPPQPPQPQQPQHIPQGQFAPAPAFNYSQAAAQPVFQPPQQSYPAVTSMQGPPTAHPPPNTYIQSYAPPPSNPQTTPQYAPQPHHQVEAPKPTVPPQNGFYQNTHQMTHQSAYTSSQIPPAPAYAPHIT